jgi:hypothetical protein
VSPSRKILPKVLVVPSVSGLAFGHENSAQLLLSAHSDSSEAARPWRGCTSSRRRAAWFKTTASGVAKRPIIQFAAAADTGI